MTKFDPEILDLGHVKVYMKGGVDMSKALAELDSVENRYMYIHSKVLNALPTSREELDFYNRYNPAFGHRREETQ